MSVDDWNVFLDKFEACLSVQETSATETESRDVWLPYVNGGDLGRAPSYLFLFDRVRFIDPLYDTCVYLTLTNDSEDSTWFESIGLPEASQGLALMGDQDGFKRFRMVGAERLIRIIDEYIELKDLFDQGVLVPFVDLHGKYGEAVSPTADFIRRYASRLVPDEFPPEVSARVNAELGAGEIISPSALMKLVDHYLDDNAIGFTLDAERFLANSLILKSVIPTAAPPNVDLGGERNEFLIDQMIDLGSAVIADYLKEIPEIKWPTEADELRIDLLSGIPNQELLYICQKERAALDHFRHRIRRKLDNMYATIGTKDYAEVVRSLQLEQRAEIAELSLLAEHIRHNYLRKVAHQLGVITCSAAAAILSASVSFKDPLTVLALGAGAAGVSTGISKIIEAWTTRAADFERLKQKDSYILWKLRTQGKQKLRA